MKNNKKAFSIAEAMIALLVISVALAMSAPLFSKRVASTNMNMAADPIPSGAVMYFDLTKCPEHWSPLTKRYADSDNAFIRNITENRSLGSLQLDGAPNITGSYSNVSFYSVEDPKDAYRVDELFDSNGALYNTPHLIQRRGYFSKAYDDEYRGGVSIDASRSSESYGRLESDGVTRVNEVRPKNIALLACRKD